MTDDSEEWGPWIEYRGETYLAGVEIGMVAQIKATFNNVEFISPPMLVDHEDMVRVVLGVGEAIIAHRIRKPRALRQLIEMVENLPAPSKQGDRVK